MRIRRESILTGHQKILRRIAPFPCFARTLVLIAGLVSPVLSCATTITYAGFAYAGESGNIASRFKFSKLYEASLQGQGTDANSKLRSILQGRHYPFDLNMMGNTEIKGDATLVTALTVTGETISDETFGPVHKLLVQIRAQAMIFDFQSKMLLRAYPLSFVYIDELDHTPSDSDIEDRVAKVYEGAQGKDGIFGRYADVLSHATLPRNDGLFVQITNVTIDPEAKPAIPPALSQYRGAAETWIADDLDEALNAYAGVPVIPYAAGYAVGNIMQLQLANSDFNIKFPEPNVEISLAITGVKRKEETKNNVGTSYIYGAYAAVKIIPHESAHATLDAQFKNGEIKKVPVTQQYVDDLPAYHDAIDGLFSKLSEVLGGKELSWLESASTTPNIKAQMAAARGLLQKCK